MKYTPVIPYKDKIIYLYKSQIFEYLCDNYKEIINIKKSALKQSDDAYTSSQIITNITKGLATAHKDDPTSGVIKRTIVGNTYYWRDSHDDVHVDGIFTKSIKDKSPNKIYHYHDHAGMLTAKVGTFSNVYEKRAMWKDLGVNVFGYTTALMADSDIKSVFNKSIYEQYLNNEIDQHSVGMNYITMSLAINSDEPAYKEHKKEWDMYYPLLGNKNDAIEYGFFWAQKEARLIEISAVGEGSNRITPTIQNIEPSDDTQKWEPTNVTQQEVKKNKGFYNYL